MEGKFKFSKIDTLHDFTFDQSLEQFRSLISNNENEKDFLVSEGTIREIIQNSLDAKNHDADGPVKIVFNISEINKDNFPGIDEIFTHIESLNPANSYTLETVNHMKELKNKKLVTVLTAEDINTKGLSGAEDKNGNSSFHAYAYNKGVHPEESDKVIEKTRGGSHGVGKIANNAASDIHLMYFANCDKNGDKHLGGSIQLFDHTLKNQSYRGAGYFTDEATVNGKIEYIPYKNNLKHDVFRKDTRGLKIIIPYLREEMNDKEDIVKSIINNYFVAIIDNKLDVEFNYYDEIIKINNESINDILEEYYNQNIEDMRYDLTPLFIQTYLNADPISIDIDLSKNETYNFNLYYYEDEKIKKGRTAIVRSVGMKIEERSFYGHTNSPYNAVLIGSAKEDEYLKTLENESHTKLSSDSIRNKEEKQKADLFIKTLNKNMREFLDKKMNEKYESDGEIDTSDLIYEMNWEFEKKINESNKKAEVDGGTKILITGGKETRDREKGGKKKPVKPRNKGKRKPRKHKDGNKEVSTYTLPNDVINRANVAGFEYISFDFSQLEGSENWRRINIGMKLVNGEGREIDNAINIAKNYKSIEELITNTDNYKYDRNRIYNIPINNKQAMLKLKTTNSYNPNLKTIYKVEVRE